MGTAFKTSVDQWARSEERKENNEAMKKIRTTLNVENK
jgi:hypothetical protein